MKVQMKRKEAKACCSCGCGEAEKKRILIEYLYLDLKTCDRCIGTDKVLEETIMALNDALLLAGYEIEYKKIEIETAELAKKHQFLSSPTIRVNGYDLFGPVKESNCGCCGEISGTDVDCRVFEYEGQSYEVPPKAMLIEAIMRSVFSPRAENCDCYSLPENLKDFFDGKEKKKSKCGCKSGCC